MQKTQNYMCSDIARHTLLISLVTTQLVKQSDKSDKYSNS